jgi:hypothetical protein
MNPKEKNIKSVFKTRQEMAKELGISVRTLRRKLIAKSIVLNGGLLNLNEQNRIYEAFGLLESTETLSNNFEKENDKE